MPNPGEIFYSRAIGTFVVYEEDERGPYYYDPRDQHTGSATYDLLDVSPLEPIVRHLHYDYALKRAEDFIAALKEAKEIYGHSQVTAFITRRIQGVKTR
jgi:hypothetical protein